MALYRTETACRACGGGALHEVLAFGATPLADRLLGAAELAQPDVQVPLTLVFCSDCSLVQIAETVAPEVLFGGDYPYFSSVSSTLLAHARANAMELIERQGLGPKSLVVEIASNDGYLLKNFVERGIPVLGIDLAAAPAAAAAAAGVRTRQAFFGRELAGRLVAEDGRADLIIANNVLAHVADLNGLVAGIALLLAPHGLAVLEMPYIADLIAGCEFDTIYHQHLCYFGIGALDRLFRRHGLVVNDVRRLLIHGGSLRLYVGHAPAVRRSVGALLAAERKAGLDRLAPYLGFAERVQGVRARLLALIARLKAPQDGATGQRGLRHEHRSHSKETGFDFRAPLFGKKIKPGFISSASGTARFSRCRQTTKRTGSPAGWPRGRFPGRQAYRTTPVPVPAHKSSASRSM